ncbi:MAG: transposase [Moorea sp. SIO2I5]|nr:transposase [Moorena sp. SIO2I5]
MKRLSMDEIAMRKGHKDFKTVVSDIEGHELLEVINSHKPNEIIEVQILLELEVRQGVEEVSIDMWGGFAKVITTVFPNALIVYDRFHVMRMVNKELNLLKRCSAVLGVSPMSDCIKTKKIGNYQS